MKQWLWLWLWGPVVVWCGLIFWLSSIPSLRLSNENVADLVLRKTAHVSFYAFLVVLVYRALVGGWQRWHWRMAGVAAGLSWMYALSDEWHQHFVAGRHGSVFDTVIDLLGIALGLAIVAWWVWWMTTIKDVTAGK